LAGILATDRRLRRAAGALVIALAAVSSGQALARGSTACSAPAVHALDIGQGTAVLVQAEGHAILVDTGPAHGGIADQLNDLGVGALDAVFVSHPHVDHALGAVDVLHSFDVGRIFGPVTLGWGGGSDVIEAASEAHVPFEQMAAGDTLTVGTMNIEVLWPPPGPAPPFSEDLVDPYSLVLRVRVGETTLLLPGDIRAEQQAELAETSIGAPLLVAPHHGSKNLDQAFVDAVGPRLTLVTVGSPNPYGLPAPEAIRAYGRHGRVFRTDQDGRVSVCLRDDGAEVVTEK
jgi:competence protein ComEC